MSGFLQLWRWLCNLKVNYRDLGLQTSALQTSAAVYHNHKAFLRLRYTVCSLIFITNSIIYGTTTETQIKQFEISIYAPPNYNSYISSYNILE